MAADPQFSKAAEAFRQGDLGLALKQAEQAVSVNPTPQWQHLLGLVHCRQGRPDLGVWHLRAAADAEPANVAFKVMLARALIDSGSPEKVLGMERPPASPGPAELALWHARAEAAAVTGNQAEAADAWAAITEACGADAVAWVNLGRSLLALSRLAEATTAYERALALSPRNGAARFELGLIYERMSRLDQLDQLLDGAAEGDIGKDDLSFLRALREQRAGNLQAAHEHLLKCDPKLHPQRWYRLRSKIADKEGDVAEAFAASVAMNRVAPAAAEWRERAADYRASLRAMAEAMTADWAASLPVLPPGTERAPAFLVGFPRSGTTLLDTFLMGHPSIVVIEEREILRRAGELAGSHERLPEESAAALERARHSYLAELSRYVDPGFDGLAIDKHPLNMVALPLIHVLFPGAPIIFVQRHPCDCVLSGYMQSFVPNLGMASFLDLEDAVDLYDAAMRVWSKAAQLLPVRAHTVIYEELVRDPETQLRSTLDFLGLEWDDRVMDHRSTAKARGPIMNTSYDQVTEGLNRAAVDRWRRYEEQLRPVLPVLLPWAAQLGYSDT